MPHFLNQLKFQQWHGIPVGYFYYLYKDRQSCWNNRIPNPGCGKEVRIVLSPLSYTGAPICTPQHTHTMHTYTIYNHFIELHKKKNIYLSSAMAKSKMLLDIDVFCKYSFVLAALTLIKKLKSSGAFHRLFVFSLFHYSHLKRWRK